MVFRFIPVSLASSATFNFRSPKILDKWHLIILLHKKYHSVANVLQGCLKVLKVSPVVHMVSFEENKARILWHTPI